MKTKLRLEELKEAKRKLMRMYAINPIKAYAETINWIDKRIGKITGVLLVLLILLTGGCNVARESCHLIGAACQDIGWTATKLGENIVVEEERQ